MFSSHAPTPEKPVCGEWTAEIARHVDANAGDEIYLVGHSLGAPAILRYLELPSAQKIAGAILVSGPIEKVKNKKIEDFLKKEFDFKTIKSKAGKVCVIHGDNDTLVPVSHAKRLAKELSAELVIVKNGGHMNGSSGWTFLPQALAALNKMFKG